MQKTHIEEFKSSRHTATLCFGLLHVSELIAVLLLAAPMRSQMQQPEWQAQLRKYTEAQDWDSAIRIVERELARSPQDMDVRAWRALVLTWSGHLAEADRAFFLQFLIFGYAFATVISIGSVLQEEITYKRYNDWQDVARLVSYCFLEHFPYRQMHMVWRLQGLWEYFRGDFAWKPLKRKGIQSSEAQ